MWLYLTAAILCACLWKLMTGLKSAWTSYKAISKALSRFPLPVEHHWFFGIAHLVKDAESYLTVMEKSVDKLQPKAMAVWVTWIRSSLLIVHPEPMKAILSASHTSAPKSTDYRFLIPWIGEGLFTSNGKKWERSRRLLTPAFHFDVLKPYVGIYNDVAELLMSKMSAQGYGGKSFNICPMINRATLDTVLRCAISYIDEGIQSTDKTEHPFFEAVDKLKEIINRRTLDPMSHNDFIFSLKSDYNEMKKRCDYVHDFSNNLIQLRKKALEKDPSELQKRHLDFLDILLTARDENGVGLTDREIRDEVDTFVLAGHDTTASAIMWSLYSLAKYPEMQMRVRDEIEDILCGRHALESFDIPKLQYTTCFIKESMRMFTPVPFHNRVLSKPVTIEGVTFPAGTRVDISPHCLHHNPAVWENHNNFDPDRFLPENISKKDPFSFLPFSAGQRNCIGQHFAMNEIKLVVSRVVTRFEITLDRNREPVPYRDLITTAKDGIYLHFKDLISSDSKRVPSHSKSN